MLAQGSSVSPEGKAHPGHALLLGWVGVTAPARPFARAAVWCWVPGSSITALRGVKSLFLLRVAGAGRRAGRTEGQALLAAAALWKDSQERRGCLGPQVTHVHPPPRGAAQG